MTKRKIIELGNIEKSKHAKPLTQGDLIERLKDYITYQKRYSNTNIEATLAGARWLVRQGIAVPPTLDDAKRIEELCRARGLKTKTIIHRLYYLRLIAECMGVELKIKMPKRTKPENDYLTLGEGRDLFDSATNRRDQALIMTMLVCGPRPCELCAIELDDVDFKNKCIHVRDHGQGLKTFTEHKAAMNDELIDAIKSWLDVRPIVESRALYLNKYGLPLNPKRLQQIIKDVSKRTTITRRVYPYMLRHSCGTNIVESGGSIMDAATQLNHKSLETTMIYLHRNFDSVQQVVGKKLHY